MRKKDSDMDKWLQAYTVPDIPEDRLSALIEDGRHYMDGSEFNSTSFRNILLSQMQYFPCSFWIVQAVTVTAVSFLVCRLGYLEVPLYYPFTVLAVMIPFLLLLSVREISKSAVYGMWEIEQSSRCQLVKITAGRMVIAGLLDLFCLTTVLAVVSHHFQQSMFRMILYGIVPFHLSCACYLWTVMKSEKKDIAYHLIVCAICISVVLLLIMKQEAVFESSMLAGWVALYMFSVFLLGKTAQKYLQHEKKLGELAWNLQ